MIKTKKRIPLVAEPSLLESLKVSMNEGTPEDQCRFLRARLPDVIRELEHEAEKPGMSPTGVELWTYDSLIVAKALELLKIIEMEQWRQREAIKLYLQGQIDRGSMRAIAYSWNGSRALEEPPEPPC